MRWIDYGLSVVTDDLVARKIPTATKADLADLMRDLSVAGSLAGFYFDTTVEPAYIAMWKDDLPGQVAAWPPPGELGGVGLFTVVLLVGMGFPLTYGLRNTAVIATACCLASAWLLRFWFASHMFRDKAVQLYPRTTAEILYCLLVLTGLAALIGWERFRSSRFHLFLEPDDPWARDTVRANRPVPKIVGVLARLMLLFASAGSATADQYMPKNESSLGRLAWVAHQLRSKKPLLLVGIHREHGRTPDLRCPAYEKGNTCRYTGQSPASMQELQTPSTL